MIGFTKLVQAELKQARIDYPKPRQSAHEAYAYIKEELDEFWGEVKRREQYRPAMLMELVQVAAMAQRAAEDLGLIVGETGLTMPSVNGGMTVREDCEIGGVSRD